MDRGRDAAIFQPSVFNSDWSFVLPSKDCSVRVTDFVEVQAPVIHIDVLKHIMHILPNNATLDWGVDLVWCRYVTGVLGIHQACRIVNTRMRHVRSRKMRRYSTENAKTMMNCLLESFPHYHSQHANLACVRPVDGFLARAYDLLFAS